VGDDRAKRRRVLSTSSLLMNMPARLNIGWLGSAGVNTDGDEGIGANEGRMDVRIEEFINEGQDEMRTMEEWECGRIFKCPDGCGCVSFRPGGKCLHDRPAAPSLAGSFGFSGE
jgi:hypothetical protein